MRFFVTESDRKKFVSEIKLLQTYDPRYTLKKLARIISEYSEDYETTSMLLSSIRSGKANLSMDLNNIWQEIYPEILKNASMYNTLTNNDIREALWGKFKQDPEKTLEILEVTKYYFKARVPRGSRAFLLDWYDLLEGIQPPKLKKEKKDNNSQKIYSELLKLGYDKKALKELINKGDSSRLQMSHLDENDTKILLDLKFNTKIGEKLLETYNLEEICEKLPITKKKQRRIREVYKPKTQLEMLGLLLTDRHYMYYGDMGRKLASKLYE